MTLSIKDDVEETWKRIPVEAGLPAVDIIDMDSFLEEHHASEFSRSRPRLEPWVTLSEFSILWLSHLHMSLAEPHGESARHRTAWAITGFATSHAVAIRSLALRGLDTPARSLLRSVIESMTVCVACLNDEDLAARYVAAQSPEDARRLWRSELSGRRLSSRFTAACDSTDPRTVEAFNEFQTWLSEETETYSQTVHASYLACAVTSMSVDADSGEMGPAFLGRASTFSVRTLETLTRSIWFFSRLLVRQVLGVAPNSERIRGYRVGEYPAGIVMVGWYVLDDLLDRYWQASTSAVDPDFEVEDGPAEPSTAV